jgi:hypothetical protein
LEPAVLKDTLQVPLPAVSVMVQLPSAPVMATVPVGVPLDPLTVTVTATAWPGMDGLGVWPVMVVVDGVVAVVTVWLTLVELLRLEPSPL